MTGLLAARPAGLVKPATTAAYSAEVLADTPLAYWKMDEASGATSILDYSGNARHMTKNSGTLGASGLLPSIPAQTSFQTPVGTVADAAWMDTNQATVKARVRFTAVFDNSNGDAVVSRYGSGAFFWLLWRSTTNHIAAQVNIGGLRNVAAVATANLNQIYEVGFTFDGSTLILYVDGASAGSLSVSGSIAQGTRAILAGRYSDSSFTDMPGELGHVAVYDHALSAARMAAHAAAA